jgi:hypothetical protein
MTRQLERLASTWCGHGAKGRKNDYASRLDKIKRKLFFNFFKERAALLFIKNNMN